MALLRNPKPASMNFMRALVRKAAEDRRSLSQEAIVILSKGLGDEIDPKARLRDALRRAAAINPNKTRYPLDPVKLDPRGPRSISVVLDASAALKSPSTERTLAVSSRLSKPPSLHSRLICLSPKRSMQYGKNIILGVVTLGICEEALDIVLDLVSAWVPCAALYREALHMSLLARMPAYDMFYLALARREDATLLTLDKALAKGAVRQGIRVA